MLSKSKGKVPGTYEPPRHKDGKGLEVQLHIFLTSSLNEGEWSASGPKYFIHV
jgi:hypothetical protein